MGTSASSKGPGGGVPMIPPWVPPVPPNPPQNPDQAEPTTDAGQDGPSPAPPDQSPAQQAIQPQSSPIAPARRFVGARLKLGKFGREGDRRYMQRGLKDYVRKGYGGRATAVRRFGGTAETAGTLYGTLSSSAGGQAQASGSALEPALLAGRSAREVMDAIIEAVRPADGTQDAEGSRAAIKDALSELLTIFPDADLLNLTEDQRGIVIERFVALDINQRVILDIGNAIQAKALTATVGLSRLKEVKEYIKQTVAAAFRKLHSGGHRVTTGRVNEVVRAALEETFQVFEEYRR